MTRAPAAAARSTNGTADDRNPGAVAFTEMGMISSWSIELRHVLLPDAKVAPLSPQAQRRFNYWAEDAGRIAGWEKTF